MLYPIDPHSFSNPNEIAIQSMDLQLEVDFNNRILKGFVTLTLQYNQPEATTLRLDTQNLSITRIVDSKDQSIACHYSEGPEWKGVELIVHLPFQPKSIIISYHTHPDAKALQWLAPAQTSGKKHPMLFSQSQSILARSWVPCQDSPAVRFTYTATIKTPAPLLALMSAETTSADRTNGLFTFKMEQPIPSYLLAIAVGDYQFHEWDSKTGVYAEAELLPLAASELEDTPQMLQACEKLFGPYRWGRYDVLILPPSFPYGGMENPRITFATPTILAGDKTLVALVAHELAHSWSGNLVTNATWNDFWLNEGFTVYIERRIMEELEGTEYAKMLVQLGWTELNDTVYNLFGPRDFHTLLKTNLDDMDPDEGMNLIPYMKGFAFLSMIEDAVGRERWDNFINQYFADFSFKSIDTESFLKYLDEKLLAPIGLSNALNIHEWVYQPGLPANIKAPVSDRLLAVEEWCQKVKSNEFPPAEVTSKWSTFEFMHYLSHIPESDWNLERMEALDAHLNFSAMKNAEIAVLWYIQAIKHQHTPAFEAIYAFMESVGRRKFIVPLYKEMAKTEAGMTKAREIFERAEAGYHPVAIDTIKKHLQLAFAK